MIHNLHYIIVLDFFCCCFKMKSSELLKKEWLTLRKVDNHRRASNCCDKIQQAKHPGEETGNGLFQLPVYSPPSREDRAGT